MQLIQMGHHELRIGNRILDSAHQELFNIIDWMSHLIEVEDVDTLSQAFELLEERLHTYFEVEKNIAQAVSFDFTQHQLSHQHLMKEFRTYP